MEDGKPSHKQSMDSLLRLFRSDVFDVQLHMTYLMKNESSGVQDYLVNELYKMGDDDVDFYLPQLCQLALLRYKTSCLHRFLLDKAGQSLHFALKIVFVMQSFVEDRSPELLDSAMSMASRCEIAIVNSTAAPLDALEQSWSQLIEHSPHGSAAAERQTSGEADDTAPAGAPPAPGCEDPQRHVTRCLHASTSEDKAVLFGLPPVMPNPYAALGEPDHSLGADSPMADMERFMFKRRRCEYFNTQNHFVIFTAHLSKALVALKGQNSERLLRMRQTLRLLNRWLLDRQLMGALTSEGPLSMLGLRVPMGDRGSRQQVARICLDLCRVFSTATRAPFLLAYETVDYDEVSDDVSLAAVSAQVLNDSWRCRLAACVLDCLASSEESFGDPSNVRQPEKAQADAAAVLHLWERLAGIRDKEWDDLTAAALGVPAPGAQEPLSPAATKGPSEAAPESTSDGERLSTPRPGSSPQQQRDEAAKCRRNIWGEPWQELTERVRSRSAFGRYKSWSLETIFVKGGDDLRQELLAAQVIRQFREVFRDAQLPLWLLDMEVLVTGASSGITSFIRDSTTVDRMKKSFKDKSLADIFKVTFADQLFEAKRHFIESYAAYSLVVWFLQVKDRHNGNLMMLSDGHVVHIDFGFMLSNSPGRNMAFEQSPFMLTQEFLDVMNGEYSAEYEYFRTLIIRGFLEARKQVERIILPIRMMVCGGSKLPCFREGGEYVLQSLQERFFVALTEEACIDKIIELIDASVNNWRTITYHNIQRFTHGIL